MASASASQNNIQNEFLLPNSFVHKKSGMSYQLCLKAFDENHNAIPLRLTNLMLRTIQQLGEKCFQRYKDPSKVLLKYEKEPEKFTVVNEGHRKRPSQKTKERIQSIYKTVFPERAGEVAMRLFPQPAQVPASSQPLPPPSPAAASNPQGRSATSSYKVAEIPDDEIDEKHNGDDSADVSPREQKRPSSPMPMPRAPSPMHIELDEEEENQSGNNTSVAPVSSQVQPQAQNGDASSASFAQPQSAAILRKKAREKTPSRDFSLQPKPITTEKYPSREVQSSQDRQQLLSIDEREADDEFIEEGLAWLKREGITYDGLRVYSQSPEHFNEKPELARSLNEAQKVLEILCVDPRLDGTYNDQLTSRLFGMRKWLHNSYKDNYHYYHHTDRALQYASYCLLAKREHKQTTDEGFSDWCKYQAATAVLGYIKTETSSTGLSEWLQEIPVKPRI